ncbi:hypothetical protein HK100_010208 [Physocladia obscura]|uniref:ABC transmembrane type-1 domain-containing protein n=1 Tax=Physocladia obscura TaxID=109957 RepID=A0AAD5X9X3_9FUNG|nr:hypothetical protein HK100_010208 [Physocladia obscura]
MTNVPIPEYNSSLISRWTYSWLNPLLRVGKSHPLRQDDLWTLDNRFTAEELSSDLREAWLTERIRPNGEKSLPETRLLRAIFDAFGKEYIFSAIYMFIRQTLQIASSVILLYLIQWIQTGSENRAYGLWYGYVLGISLFASQLGATLSFNKHLELTMKMGFRLRTSLISAIYNKAFVISNEARAEFTVGKIINLTATGF